jgi:hypothetical protein
MKRGGVLVRMLGGVALVVVVGSCFDWGQDGYGTIENRSGSVVRLAIRSDPVSVAVGETLTGDLVVIGGEARVEGEIRGSLVVIAGRLHVGPTAAVYRDLVAVGNEVTDIASGVHVGGAYVAVNFPGVRWMVENALFIWDNPLLFMLVGLVGIAIALYLAYRVLIRAYDPLRFHGTVEHQPVRAGLIGLILLVAIHALTLGAFLSRWASGLVVPLVLASIVLGFLGWLMVAVHVGRVLAERRGWKLGPFMYGLIGFAIVSVGSLVPIVGQLAAFIISLVGVGALVSPSKLNELPHVSRAPAAPPPDIDIPEIDIQPDPPQPDP